MLPCPFCGSDDLIFWRNASEKQSRYMVACERCNTSGPPKPRGEEAVEAWNHRTASDARDAASEMGSDGKSGLKPDSRQNDLLLLEARRRSFAEKKREKLTPPLRFDGIYQSEEDVGTVDGRTYWKYLRFYRNGTVLGCCMAAGPDACIHLLNRRNESGDLFRGQYKILGSTIRFSTVNSFGTLDYQGVIRNQRIELEYESRSTGAQGIIDFHFICLPEQFSRHETG